MKKLLPAALALYTQDGKGAQRQGEGISLAVLVPEGKNLSADQSYLPTLIQGEFVNNFAKDPHRNNMTDWSCYFLIA
jgi:hypothetical protein